VGVSDGLAAVVAASIIISLGLAPVFGLTTELIVGSAPPERAGAASGVSETASELGGALGISVLGSIGVAVYRAGVADLPSEIPPAAAVVARDTLGGAVGVAQGLPRPVGAELLAAAEQAFVSGMQVAVWISLVLAIGLAVLAVAMLRNVRLGSDAEPPGEATTNGGSAEPRRAEGHGGGVAIPDAS
jgi:DHA2 family multidrug resistance protein-like MFS transporter